MDISERKFGRLESFDARDASFPVSAILMEVPPQLTEKYWWADGWWGDQGSTSECTCYSWMHWLEDGPVVQDLQPHRQKPLISPNKLYKAAQERDQWAGTAYNGSSVRAVARCLKELGVITEYRWASNISDIINTVLTVGPMVVGTKWYEGMNSPNNEGRMRITGRDYGGHAYVINGVDTKKNMFRIKNSWGKAWGKQGYAFIDIDDFNKLFLRSGEACVAFEKKVLVESINWNNLSPPAVNTD